MHVKKTSQKYRHSLPFMHTQILILLVEYKLQYVIWLQRKRVEPKNDF